MAAKNTPKKQEEKTEQQQDSTIKVPPDLKAALDEIKGNDSYADAIRRLMIMQVVKEAPEEGMVTLRMTKKAYELLVPFQPSSLLSDILIKARV